MCWFPVHSETVLALVVGVVWLGWVAVEMRQVLLDDIVVDLSCFDVACCCWVVLGIVYQSARN